VPTLPHVINTVDLYEGQTARRAACPRVGGGLCGSEAAAYLAEQGKAGHHHRNDARAGVPGQQDGQHVLAIRDLLDKTGVIVRTRTKLVEVTPAGAVVEAGGVREDIAADTVVIATGFARISACRDRP